MLLFPAIALAINHLRLVRMEQNTFFARRRGKDYRALVNCTATPGEAPEIVMIKLIVQTLAG